MSERRRRTAPLVIPRPRLAADSALLQPASGDGHGSDSWRFLRFVSEFVDGFDVLEDIGDAVTCFGSARIFAGDPHYGAGYAVGAALARRGFAVITGGGPGLTSTPVRGRGPHRLDLSVAAIQLLMAPQPTTASPSTTDHMVTSGRRRSSRSRG
jgi:hypothetical protein